MLGVFGADNGSSKHLGSFEAKMGVLYEIKAWVFVFFLPFFKGKLLLAHSLIHTYVS